MPIDSPIQPDMTINETIARFPTTARVFNRYGIDTCCGGGSTIAEGARLERHDPRELIEALRRAAAA
jgi:regulator of cell morphogenesis and NO signaling